VIGLPEAAAAFARRQGRAAAAALLSGTRPTPCPYDRNGGLTHMRMAREWGEAFAQAMAEGGRPRPPIVYE
jgi:hypothetical protein